MTAVLSFATATLILAAAVFALGGAIGLNRFPDVYSRMHAASKAGTLGSCLALLAIAVHSPTVDVLPKALAGVAFFLLTVPLSAHLLARAAIRAGYRPVAHRDDLSTDAVVRSAQEQKQDADQKRPM